MSETAVPWKPVPKGAVPVPRKKPLPDRWKLAECRVALYRKDAEAVSTTVSMICTSVTRWIGCTIIVVCISMTTGSTITNRKQSSDQRYCVLENNNELLYS